MLSEKCAIIVASFGTSHNETRKKTIDAIEISISRAIKKAFPQHEAFRAFTSEVIIQKLFVRDGVTIRNVDETLERLAKSRFTNVVIQPTHIMNGIEYDSIIEDMRTYVGAIKRVKCGLPLLFYNEEKDSALGSERLAEIILEENADLSHDDTAIVMVGHGTEHKAHRVYQLLEDEIRRQGGKNYFVGTVEGGETSEKTLNRLVEAGYTKAALMPFMIVAGEHAATDIAGDDDHSWKSVFERGGVCCECLAKGLGEYKKIRDLFAEKALQAVSES